jgi:hypothetical protein
MATSVLHEQEPSKDQVISQMQPTCMALSPELLH